MFLVDLTSTFVQSKKIVCVGRNYEMHVKELGNDVPSVPVFFLKPTTAYITRDEKIITPPGCVDLQHEVELGLIISKTGKNIAEDKAMDWIQGYTLALDMTARDEQRKAKNAGVPWTLAKMFDTSCPVGEFISKDKISDPHALDIWLSVNGVKRQRSNTKYFIFRIPQILSYVSQFITLEPGDLVLTGTPEGVGRVVSGDIIQAGLVQMGEEITKIEFHVK
ncbi:acylpyruvase FAHD1, mitochondrial isoform X2 [Eurytemora carolleeae]|uniref:acylpyruvase FAHD1, mitochondrial isoform X2 n=1 Tax=Eurytemora carolleeae TaxID=1294199 RepID=UPI000C7820AD|nr:acylpyruvase FAHD1, mitochondrial isoform X2 [Eurytemora carolleeae]|eukprot:XP_023323792.1 acylpyruvase FAHD1, mitochondrial-like isoform X2 [Eurytemora affinis]